MDRRDFVGVAALALLSPFLGSKKSPRIVELEAELRKRFGDDTELVMAAVHDAIKSAVAERPELDPRREEDLDAMVDLAHGKLVASLRKLEILA